MKETQHILKGLTSSSLVIIDELCRGTSVEEGTSMAWAISEQLIMSGAFTFFTTHFLCLTRLQDLYYNVVNRHTVVSEEVNSEGSDRKLVYQHKIEIGVTKIEHYGLALAEKTNLPHDTVNLAKELAGLIAKIRQPQVLTSSNKSDGELLYELHTIITNESRKLNTNDTESLIIRQFKNKYPELIERLRLERSRLSNTSNIITHSPSENISKTTDANDFQLIEETSKACA